MEKSKRSIGILVAPFNFAERKPFAIPNPTISLTRATGRATRYLESVLSKLALGLVVNSRRLLGRDQLAAGGLLALVVCAALNLSPLLESGDNVLVLPANLVAQTADGAVLAARAEAEDTQSLGNDDTLLLVIRRRNTLEDLEALHSGGTTGGLVGNHAADSLVEDAGRGAEVEGAATGGVVTGHLAQVGVVLELGAEELARDVESLGADNDDLLAVEELLRNDAGEAAQKVALAIDDDERLKGRHLDGDDCGYRVR
jgi:hypothetical protein